MTSGNSIPVDAMVAITGGRGNIGTEIQNVLNVRGIPFRTLGRSAPPRDDPRHLVGSTTDPECVDRLIDGATVLMHLARTTHDLNDMCSYDYPALAPILNAAVARRLEVHFPSSQMVHDSARSFPLALIDEDHPHEPHDPYGAMKLAWEKSLVAMKQTQGLRYIIYRFPTIIPGRLSMQGGLGRYLKLGLETGVISPSDDSERFGGHSIIHVEQVAEIMVANIGNTRAYGREYNVCNSRYLYHRDTARLCADVLCEQGIDVRLNWDITGEPGPDFMTMQMFSNARARQFLGFNDIDERSLLRQKLSHALASYLAENGQE